MTGWRCGWTIAPAPVVAAEHAIQSHATSNVTSITQKAVLEALTGSQDSVVRMLDEYRERRDQLHAWLTVDERLRATKPAGAFYLWLDVRALLSADGITTSAAFAQTLLDTSRVAVTPGEAFGAPGFVRLSFATSMEQLREGSRRILEFARKPQKPTMNA
jgi:aspartate aminotransferase